MTTTAPPAEPAFRPYVPPEQSPPEFTWSAVVAGSLLGIVFGASSLYLVLKVGLTVSASIPVAVLSITLFRGVSKLLGTRSATILENNIAQTAGSAGESIAFGVGVTIPALLLLGFDMELTRVMTVGVLGGLLGILMMIPLRRAFIVQQHGQLVYPEGKACADVLVSGERGGTMALMVFGGFGLAFVHKLLTNVFKLWKDEVGVPVPALKKGVLGGELSPELLGVGYIVGPRIASITFAGGVLAYLVLVPLIAFFGENQAAPIAPAQSAVDAKSGLDVGLIKNMRVKEIRDNYILYIGAGAVATGGVISMLQAMPVIVGSVVAGLRDIRRGGGGSGASRTERDMPMSVVLLGCLGMVVALAAVPSLGLGVSVNGLVGAVLIVVFGFLFVTVSSRLTGEIGSSNNPISGMTVATLLFTCLAFLALGQTGKAATLTALTVAAVVCIASSNGGTTAQDLKTGYLVGATPRLQQWAILIGALSSAFVMGATLLFLNAAGTVYTNRAEYLPAYRVPDVSALTQRERPGKPHEADATEYHVLNVGEGEIAGVPQGRYLVDDTGAIRYLVDPAINGRVETYDLGPDDTEPRPAQKYNAPKTRLMALIIDGILNQKLPWGLVLIGALIAVTMHLCGVPALAFAVGVYLPISTTLPIFIGGMARWLVDTKLRPPVAEGDEDSSPGVLLSSGYIAGGAIAGVLAAALAFAPDAFNDRLDLSKWLLPATWNDSNAPAMVAFGVLVVGLVAVGAGWLFKSPPVTKPSSTAPLAG